MISVVIPTYNRAHYLNRALKSLQEQNFSENFEVVVVDDGSIDQTAEVVKTWSKQLNLKLVGNSHQGVSVARNLGIKNATGEILVFFDDDAVAAKDWLQNIKETMAKEDIITGRVEPLKNNLWRFFAPHYNQGATAKESPVLLEGNCAVKKSVFNQVGDFDQNLDYGHEGEEFIARAAKKYKIKYYPQVLIYHDYASGLFNYFKKQKKFGEKMAYLNLKKIKNLPDLFFNYKKIKNAKAALLPPSEQKISLPTKIAVKLIARMGEGCHFWGAVGGYLKYRK